MPDPRFEILRSDPFAEGMEFGAAGAYERIAGRVHLAIDPAQPGVYDLVLAERGADGLVHVTADLWVLQPVDAARGNRRVLFDLLNRGNKRTLQFFNDAPASNDPLTRAQAGNGFLMRQGYTIVAVAWQGDVLPGDGRMTVRLPVARNPDGSAITARIRAEFISDRPGIACLPLSGKHGTHSYATSSLDPHDAELVRRRYPGSATEVIPPHAWSFAMVQGDGRVRTGEGDITGEEQGIVPSATHIHLPRGFEPGWIYELTYTARDPLVLDLGFVTVRDAVAGLRQGLGPLRAPVEKAYCWGRSQSGRAIRDFIHRGFNVDADGQRVFDGMLSHIAGGGKTTMNRFTNLVVAASRQFEDQLNPSDRFPFSYASSTDHLTGTTDAIMKRPATDPLVIHTQSASEYWHRRGSLVHTDTRGNDLAQPDNVRVYFWSSSQHWADPIDRPPTKGPVQNLQNVVATSALFRAKLVLLDRWASGLGAPPPSRVPTREDGTLETMAAYRAHFPAIPGVALPIAPNELSLVDYGPDFDSGREIDEPPVVHQDKRYAVLVPAPDATGNDAAGVRAPMVEAPLATYTGWNLRARGHGAGALHEFSGSTIPLPESAEERVMTGDPRASILERYGDAEGYVAAIRAAAEHLVEQGFLLEEDVPRAVATARDWGRPRHDTRLPK